MSAPHTDEEEFNFYLKLAKPLVLNLSHTNDRIKAAAWIRKLRDDRSSPALRTSYLKLLLFMLQRRRLMGPFAAPPEASAPLESFPADSNLQDIAKTYTETDEQLLREVLAEGGYGEWPPYTTACSTDLTEYAATQEIPNFGTHAYFAISKEPIRTWNKFSEDIVPKAERLCSGEPDLTISPDTSPDISSFVPSEEIPTAGAKAPLSPGRLILSPAKTPSPAKETPEKSEKIVRFDDQDKDFAWLDKLSGKDVDFEKLKEEQDRDEFTKEARIPPTWGSNLIKVAESPAERRISRAPSLPYLTPPVKTYKDYMKSVGLHELPFRPKLPKDSLERQRSVFSRRPISPIREHDLFEQSFQAEPSADLADLEISLVDSDVEISPPTSPYTDPSDFLQGEFSTEAFSPDIDFTSTPRRPYKSKRILHSSLELMKRKRGTVTVPKTKLAGIHELERFVKTPEKVPPRLPIADIQADVSESHLFKHRVPGAMLDEVEEPSFLDESIDDYVDPATYLQGDRIVDEDEELRELEEDVFGEQAQPSTSVIIEPGRVQIVQTPGIEAKIKELERKMFEEEREQTSPKRIQPQPGKPSRAAKRKKAPRAVDKDEAEIKALEMEIFGREVTPPKPAPVKQAPLSEAQRRLLEGAYIPSDEEVEQWLEDAIAGRPERQRPVQLAPLSEAAQRILAGAHNPTPEEVEKWLEDAIAGRRDSPIKGLETPPSYLEAPSDYNWMEDLSGGTGIPVGEEQDSALWQPYDWWTDDPNVIFQHVPPSPLKVPPGYVHMWPEPPPTPPLFSRDPRIRFGPEGQKVYSIKEFGMESFEEPVWTSAEKYLLGKRAMSPFKDPRDDVRSGTPDLMLDAPFSLTPASYDPNSDIAVERLDDSISKMLAADLDIINAKLPVTTPKRSTIPHRNLLGERGLEFETPPELVSSPDSSPRSPRFGVPAWDVITYAQKHPEAYTGTLLDDEILEFESPELKPPPNWTWVSPPMYEPKELEYYSAMATSPISNEAPPPLVVSPETEDAPITTSTEPFEFGGTTYYPDMFEHYASRPDPGLEAETLPDLDLSFEMPADTDIPQTKVQVITVPGKHKAAMETATPAESVIEVSAEPEPTVTITIPEQPSAAEERRTKRKPSKRISFAEMKEVKLISPKKMYGKLGKQKSRMVKIKLPAPPTPPPKSPSPPRPRTPSPPPPGAHLPATPDYVRRVQTYTTPAAPISTVHPFALKPMPVPPPIELPPDTGIDIGTPTKASPPRYLTTTLEERERLNRELSAKRRLELIKEIRQKFALSPSPTRTPPREELPQSREYNIRIEDGRVVVSPPVAPPANWNWVSPPMYEPKDFDYYSAMATSPISGEAPPPLVVSPETEDAAITTSTEPFEFGGTTYYPDMFEHYASRPDPGLEAETLPDLDLSFEMPSESRDISGGPQPTVTVTIPEQPPVQTPPPAYEQGVKRKPSKRISFAEMKEVKLISPKKMYGKLGKQKSRMVKIRLPPPPTPPPKSPSPPRPRTPSPPPPGAHLPATPDYVSRVQMYKHPAISSSAITSPTHPLFAQPLHVPPPIQPAETDIDIGSPLKAPPPRHRILWRASDVTDEYILKTIMEDREMNLRAQSAERRLELIKEIRQKFALSPSPTRTPPREELPQPREYNIRIEDGRVVVSPPVAPPANWNWVSPDKESAPITTSTEPFESGGSTFHPDMFEYYANLPDPGLEAETLPDLDLPFEMTADSRDIPSYIPKDLEYYSAMMTSPISNEAPPPLVVSPETEDAPITTSTEPFAFGGTTYYPDRFQHYASLPDPGLEAETLPDLDLSFEMPADRDIPQTTVEVATVPSRHKTAMETAAPVESIIEVSAEPEPTVTITIPEQPPVEAPSATEERRTKRKPSKRISFAEMKEVKLISPKKMYGKLGKQKSRMVKIKLPPPPTPPPKSPSPPRPRTPSPPPPGAHLPATPDYVRRVQIHAPLAAPPPAVTSPTHPMFKRPITVPPPYQPADTDIDIGSPLKAPPFIDEETYQARLREEEFFRRVRNRERRLQLLEEIQEQYVPKPLSPRQPSPPGTPHMLDEPLPQDLPTALLPPSGWTYSTPPHLRGRGELQVVTTPTAYVPPKRFHKDVTLAHESPPDLFYSPEMESPEGSQYLSPIRSPGGRPIYNQEIPSDVVDYATKYPDAYGDLLDEEELLYESPERPVTPKHLGIIKEQEIALGLRQRSPTTVREFEDELISELEKEVFGPKQGQRAIAPPPSMHVEPSGDETEDSLIRDLERVVFGSPTQTAVVPLSPPTSPVRPSQVRVPTPESPETPELQRRLWRQELELHQIEPVRRKVMRVRPSPGKSYTVRRSQTPFVGDIEEQTEPESPQFRERRFIPAHTRVPILTPTKLKPTLYSTKLPSPDAPPYVDYGIGSPLRFERPTYRATAFDIKERRMAALKKDLEETGEPMPEDFEYHILPKDRPFTDEQLEEMEIFPRRKLFVAPESPESPEVPSWEPGSPEERETPPSSPEKQTTRIRFGADGQIIVSPPVQPPANWTWESPPLHKDFDYYSSIQTSPLTAEAPPWLMMSPGEAGSPTDGSAPESTNLFDYYGSSQFPLPSIESETMPELQGDIESPPSVRVPSLPHRVMALPPPSVKPPVASETIVEVATEPEPTVTITTTPAEEVAAPVSAPRVDQVPTKKKPSRRISFAEFKEVKLISPKKMYGKLGKQKSRMVKIQLPAPPTPPPRSPSPPRPRTPSPPPPGAHLPATPDYVRRVQMYTPPAISPPAVTSPTHPMFKQPIPVPPPYHPADTGIDIGSPLKAPPFIDEETYQARLREEEFFRRVRNRERRLQLLEELQEQYVPKPLSPRQPSPPGTPHMLDEPLPQDLPMALLPPSGWTYSTPPELRERGKLQVVTTPTAYVPPKRFHKDVTLAHESPPDIFYSPKSPEPVTFPALGSPLLSPGGRPMYQPRSPRDIVQHAEQFPEYYKDTELDKGILYSSPEHVPTPPAMPEYLRQSKDIIEHAERFPQYYDDADVDEGVLYTSPEHVPTPPATPEYLRRIREQEIALGLRSPPPMMAATSPTPPRSRPPVMTPKRLMPAVYPSTAPGTAALNSDYIGSVIRFIPKRVVPMPETPTDLQGSITPGMVAHMRRRRPIVRTRTRLTYDEAEQEYEREMMEELLETMTGGAPPDTLEEEQLPEVLDIPYEEIDFRTGINFEPAVFDFYRPDDYEEEEGRLPFEGQPDTVFDTSMIDTGDLPEHLMDFRWIDVRRRH